MFVLAFIFRQNAEITAFKNAIKERHPLLTDVYCFADGLKLMLQQSGDVVFQNRYYNGYTHDHYVWNVLVFVPSGRLMSCALNSPGCLHDHTIAGYGSVYVGL